MVRVRIEEGDGELIIRPVYCRGGGSAHDEATVRLKPGQSWRGWKYRRLRRLGEGEHSLIAKADPMARGGE